MTRSPIFGQEPETGVKDEYNTSAPLSFFNSFMANAVDVRQGYEFSLDSLFHQVGDKALSTGSLASTNLFSLDSLFSISNLSPDAKPVTQEKIQFLEKKFPGSKVIPGTPDWLATAIAHDHAEQNYYSAFADLGRNTGAVNHGAALAGVVLGQLTDIPADIFSAVTAGFGGKALEYGFSKLMKQSFMDTMIGNPWAQNAIGLAHSSVKTGLATGGFTLGTVPTQIASAKEQGKPISALNIMSNLGHSYLAGMKWGIAAKVFGIGGGAAARYTLKKVAGVSDNELKGVEDAYQVVTPSSVYAMNLDAMGQFVNGKDPYVHHIMKSGKYDAGAILRKNLTDNNVSLDGLSKKLFNGRLILKSDYDKISGIKQMPDDLPGKVAPLVKFLKDNPQRETSPVTMKLKLGEALKDAPVDAEQFSDFVPDEINKKARLTQKDMYEDFKLSKVSRDELPKEVIDKLRGEEKIRRSQALVGRYQRALDANRKSKASRQKFTHLVNVNQKVVDTLKRKHFGFLGLDEEMRNIKSTLTDENNKPISGWQKHPAMKRLNQLKKRNNEARNYYMQLHMDDAKQLNKQFLKARNTEMLNNQHFQTMMKSLYDHVADKNKPLTYNDVKDYTDHLKAPIVSSFKWEVPPEVKKPITQQLNDTDMDLVHNQLDNLHNDDLSEELKKSEFDEKQIPIYKNMAEALKNCMLGAIK